MVITSKQRATAATMYTALATERTPFLDRAEVNAQYTVPTLMMPEGSTGSTELSDPYQSVGAMGVNNLASQLLLTLLPPGLPWFNLTVNRFELEQQLGAAGGVGSSEGQSLVTRVNEALVQIENEVHRFVDGTPSIRSALFEAMEHLLVAGNCVLFLDDFGSTKVFHLDEFVVERSPNGDLRTLVIKEVLDRDSAPEDALGAFKPKQQSADLYTVVARTGTDAKGQPLYSVHQEVNDEKVREVSSGVPKNHLPYIPLRFKKVSNQPYGRSMIEGLIGDLRVVEGESEAIAQGSVIAARTIGLVDPNGVARASELSDAANGEFVPGRNGEVTFLRVDKGADFNVTFTHLEMATRRLEQAFVSKQSVQRNAERVTAQEIQSLIQALEETLGGVYSALFGEVQLPLIHRLLVILEDLAKIPDLPETTVVPIILSGVQGLGRGRDFNTLATGGQMLKQIIGDAEFARIHHSLEYASRIWNALGVETDSLMKTEAELAKELADQRNAQIALAAAGPAMSGIAQGAAQQQQV